jgi:hypothetical protein
MFAEHVDECGLVEWYILLVGTPRAIIQRIAEPVIGFSRGKWRPK